MLLAKRATLEAAMGTGAGEQPTGERSRHPTALDAAFILFAAGTILLFLLWVVTSLTGQPQFTNVPAWLREIVSSVWAWLSVLGASVALLFIRTLLVKSPAPNYLIWIPLGFVFLLVALLCVWSVVRRIRANPNLKPSFPELSNQQSNPVEDLVHQIDHLRGDFEASPSNESLRLKVNKDAARLANQAKYIDDSGLDLANKIAKYEYIAYAFVMAASADTNPAKRLEFVKSSLDFGDKANAALRDLDGRTPNDEEAKRARVWAMQDQPKDRVAFLATMAWCIDYSTTHDISSRHHARDEWAQVTGSFRDQYKQSTPELENCVLPQKKRKRH